MFKKLLLAVLLLTNLGTVGWAKENPIEIVEQTQKNNKEDINFFKEMSNERKKYIAKTLSGKNKDLNEKEQKELSEAIKNENLSVKKMLAVLKARDNKVSQKLSELNQAESEFLFFVSVFLQEEGKIREKEQVKKENLNDLKRPLTEEENQKIDRLCFEFLAYLKKQILQKEKYPNGILGRPIKLPEFTYPNAASITPETQEECNVTAEDYIRETAKSKGTTLTAELSDIASTIGMSYIYTSEYEAEKEQKKKEEELAAQKATEAKAAELKAKMDSKKTQ